MNFSPPSLEDYLRQEPHPGRLQGGSRIRGERADPGRGTAPLFTIVTAVYNQEKDIEKTILSITGQTFSDYEYVVVDGGSDDGTVEILRKFEECITYWLSEPDRGIYDAYNKGVAFSSGRWVLFLNADDCLHSPEVLSDAAIYLGQSKAAPRLMYGTVHEVDGSGKLIRISGAADSDDFRKWWGMPFQHQGLFTARELFEKFGLFNHTAFRVLADYDFLMRFCSRGGEKPRFIPVTIATARRGGISTCLAEQFRIFRENQTIRKKHELQFFSEGGWKKGLNAFLASCIARACGELRAARWIDAYRGMMGKPKRWT